MENRSAKNVLLAGLIMITAAGCLVAVMTGAVSMDTALIIAVIAAVVFFGIHLALNYKSSAYGGAFKTKYPDAH